MPTDSAFEGCVRAFVNRDYIDCARQAQALLAAGARFGLMQLLLISLQRSGQTPLVEQICTGLVKAGTPPSWQDKLLLLTLGQIDPDEVFAQAENEEQRCQALYYAGARLLTAGRTEAARAAFTACLGMKIQCLEQLLAKVERVSSETLGPSIPAEDTRRRVARMGEQAMELSRQGRRVEALVLARETCELARQELGAQHPETAATLNNLGMLLREMADLTGARSYLEQALAIFRRVLGEEHLATAHSLYNLGGLLLALGDVPGAQLYYEQALAIRRKILGAEHPDTAAILNDLGYLLSVMSDFSGAQAYHEQALAIYRRVLGEEHPYTATSLHNLGSMLHVRGDLVGARLYYEQALAIRRKLLDEEHLDTASSLNNLGRLLQEMGDLTGARPYCEQALAIDRKLQGAEHPDTALRLVNLGRLLQEMGDLTGARPYLEQALAILRRVLGEEHPNTALSLHNLAGLDAATGRTFNAFELMRRAAATDDRMIGQIVSIGSDAQRLAFLRQGQRSLGLFLSLVFCGLTASVEAVCAAFDLVLRRKAIAAEALAAQRDAVLGGKYPALEPQLRECTTLRRQIAQKTLAGPGPEGLPAHQMLLAQWDQQKERLETELARRIPEMNLEQKLRATDRRAVALALPEDVALVEFVRFDVFDFQAVPARGESRWQPARYLAFVLPAGQPEQVQMIDLGEADLIDQMIADFRAGITTPPWQRPDRGQKAPSASAGGLWDWLFGRRKRRDRGQKMYTDADDSPAQARSASVASMPRLAAELRQRVFDPLLPALGDHIQLWLSPDGDLTRLPFEVLPDREQGKLLLDSYRISYLATGRDVLRCGLPPTRQPALPLVAADPDFDLSASASPGERGCVNAPSTPGAAATGLAGQPRGSTSRRSRDAERAEPVQRLEGTRLEGERIAALLGVQPVLAGAVLDQPLKAMRSPRILHLATHGFFFQDQQLDPGTGWRDLGAPDRLAGSRFENPMLRSGLLLAGFNTWRNGGEPPATAEDGMLTAEDVTGMDLIDTELVVLSACETGLGQIHVGEGVFGLRRAFAVAGARTLVMSLWKVPDEQTQELMVDFYQRILRGEGRAEALRQAQQALRTRDGGKYADPYYWGAFICQGDPAPLPRT